MDKAWFHSIFTTTNIFSAKLQHYEYTQLPETTGTILSCLRGGEAVLQPTNRGQLRYFGSSWKTQFKKMIFC